MPTKVKTGRTIKRPFKRLPRGEHGGVQLLLIHNVEHLGKQGDIVEVKPGYAMNYLVATRFGDDRIGSPPTHGRKAP